MYNVCVEDLFGNFVHDTCVPCWEDVEKVYFAYRQQFPGYDVTIRSVKMIVDELLVIV